MAQTSTLVRATVAFDVLGTCFSLDVVNKAVDERFGQALRTDGVNVVSFVLEWWHSVQRDYVSL